MDLARSARRDAISTSTTAMLRTYTFSAGSNFRHSRHDAPEPGSRVIRAKHCCHEPAVQDGWIPADARARCDDPPALDKTGELMVMFTDLQAKMEQRMALIEGQINAIKNR